MTNSYKLKYILNYHAALCIRTYTKGHKINMDSETMILLGAHGYCTQVSVLLWVCTKFVKLALVLSEISSVKIASINNCIV